MDLYEKVHILVKMIGFSSRTGKCTLRNDKLLNTCPVIFSGFLDAVIKQFLSKEKLLANKRKQSLPLKIFGGFSFRDLSFRGLSFKVLDLRS